MHRIKTETVLEVSGPWAMSCAEVSRAFGRDQLCPGASCTKQRHFVCSVKRGKQFQLLRDLGIFFSSPAPTSDVAFAWPQLEWLLTGQSGSATVELTERQAGTDALKKTIRAALVADVARFDLSRTVSSLVGPTWSWSNWEAPTEADQQLGFGFGWDAEPSRDGPAKAKAGSSRHRRGQHKPELPPDYVSDRAGILTVQQLLEFYRNADGEVDFGPFALLKDAANNCALHLDRRCHWGSELAKDGPAWPATSSTSTRDSDASSAVYDGRVAALEAANSEFKKELAELRALVATAGLAVTKMADTVIAQDTQLSEQSRQLETQAQQLAELQSAVGKAVVMEGDSP